MEKNIAQPKPMNGAVDQKYIEVRIIKNASKDIPIDGVVNNINVTMTIDVLK